MRRTFTLLFGLAVAASASTAGAETLKVAVAQRGFWNSTLVDIAETAGLLQGGRTRHRGVLHRRRRIDLDAAASPAPSTSRCRTASSA